MSQVTVVNESDFRASLEMIALEYDVIRAVLGNSEAMSELSDNYVVKKPGDRMYITSLQKLQVDDGVKARVVFNSNPLHCARQDKETAERIASAITDDDGETAVAVRVVDELPLILQDMDKYFGELKEMIG